MDENEEFRGYPTDEEMERMYEWYMEQEEE